MTGPITSVRVRRGDAAGGETTERDDEVVTEAALEIRLDGEPLAVLMRTPGHDVELALGLLRAEGVIARPEDVLSAVRCSAEDEESTLDVRLARPAEAADRRRAERALLSSSSCGVCGKRTLEDLHHRAPPFPADLPDLDPALIAALPGRLREAQPVFTRTGGLHGAALFDADGHPRVTREDVGRHNAVDKCIGHFLATETPWPEMPILVVSGRVSFEIVEKALVARVPTLVAVSAPSSLAIEVAARSGMRLYGFVRGGGYNRYA